jgi:hypothetical protein
MAEAIHVNKSGRNVNGPRPETLKPPNQCIIGLDVKEYRIRAIVNMTNPILNCDLVL